MTKTQRALSALLLALAAAGGCKKSDDKEAPPSENKTTEPATPAPVDDKTAEEAKAKEDEAKRAAETLAKDQAKAAEEAKRWTPELEKKAAALAARANKDTKKALEAILASPHRMPGNPERDVYRHPIETLSFFHIRPDMTVVEMGVGEGWYTEILAPLVAQGGKLVVLSADPAGPPDTMRTVFAKRVARFLGKSPALFGKVQVAVVDPPARIEIGPPGSADLVMAMREMHNWQRRGEIDAYLAAIHAVLKDGGTFGVEQHRAAPGGKAEETAEKGYLPEDWLIQKIEAAGFELEEKSEINANPKDTKDYEKGVWTLPPNYREGDKDKAKYTAIGESDRMTLRFVKTGK
jgi:predicted methyltransferase